MSSLRIELFLPILITTPLNAQMVADGEAYAVKLSDGVETVVMSGADQRGSYYYLPKTIQVSKKGGIPQISLMLFENNNKQITGGILHVLLTWGLTNPQQEELSRNLISKVDSAGIISGAAQIELAPNELSFNDDPDLGAQLENCSSSRIKLATTPEQKAAISFKLTPELAQYFHQRISAKSKSSLRMKAVYTYVVVTPGKNVSIAEKRRGTMSADLTDWIKDIKQYKLIKIVKV